MINKLSIRNFKSIRELDLDCRRVNVFIGDPNAGKTNILEAFGFWCRDVIEGKKLAFVTRSNQVADLFADQDIANPITIMLDDKGLKIQGSESGSSVSIIHPNAMSDGYTFDNAINVNTRRNWPPVAVSFYKFSSDPTLSEPSGIRLAPPFGSNLATLLYSNKAARKSSAQFFEGSGFRLNVDFTSKKVLVTKENDGVLVSFPYSSCSETLRRMVFYHLALDTNSERILVFDEPEANSFPPYTKTLAERIALDDRGNQFFLTTHSPYMLDSLLSKTPAKDLNVVLCRMENFETKAYPLNQEQIDQIKEWSMDAFFNFDRLLPEVK